MSDKATNKTLMNEIIAGINKVEGFDPTPFAVDFVDLNTEETHKRLPVVIQVAWFRLKYPEGKIAIKVVPSGEFFVATARVYPSYKDSEEHYLAEATASRSYCADKPSVSPREWAQTAAVGIALRNAGFGLQFAMAGAEFEDIATDELGVAKMKPQVEQEIDGKEVAKDEQIQQAKQIQKEEYVVDETPKVELTHEEKLQRAMNVLCPISKFRGKTLGEVLQLEASAVHWVAEKFKGSDEIKEAAKFICEHALQEAIA